MALVVPQDSSAFDVILLLATLPLALLSNSLIAPFWQTLKAVVYYDIRSRREGIDLQIRDI